MQRPLPYRLFCIGRPLCLLLAAGLLLSGLTAGAQSGRLARANQAYADMAYTPAIELYRSVLEVSEDFEAMWKLADCYRLTSQYREAEYWFRKVVRQDAAQPEHFLYYAQMLQVNQKYEEAAWWYGAYKEAVPGDVRADNQMRACMDPDAFYADSGRYVVSRLPFNSDVYDFGPALFNGGLVFSSSRDTVRSINRVHTWTGQAFFDLFYVERKGRDWSEPELLRGDVNTRYHEGPVAFSPDGRQVYFTRNNFDNSRVVGKTGRSLDKVVKLKLYIADVHGTEWTNIREFEFSNDEYSVGHAGFSPDGRTLYFVSDMPGGYGGTDLYYCERQGVTWSLPRNLGPAVNTEGNEMFPNVDAEGDLYFASDGHGGLGGLDVFRSRGRGTDWGEAYNLGFPVNTSADDFGLIYKPDMSGGYLVSNRRGGSGSDDIYSFSYRGLRLEGIAVDALSESPVCGAAVNLVSPDGGPGGLAETDCDGKFSFEVLPGRDYLLQGCAEGYACEEVRTTARGVKPGEPLFVRLSLQPLAAEPEAPEPAPADTATPAVAEPLHLEVAVVDAVTGEALPFALVSVFDQCLDSYIYKEGDDAGMARFYDVEAGCTYRASANAEGYLPGEAEAATAVEGRVLRVRVALDPISGGPVVLRHIYYDFNQSTIRPESEADLNKLLNFMELNPAAVVEIGSHTDSRASDRYNEALSERRARAVVDWLVARGVSPDRLVAVGYGELQPVNHCTDNVPCSEEEHQRNRRTEFRVLDNSGLLEIRSEEREDIGIDPCPECPF